MNRTRKVLVAVAAAVAVPASSASAGAVPVSPDLESAGSRQAFVERAAGEPVRPVSLGAVTDLAGVSIVAPENATYRTGRAMISLIEPGQPNRVVFGLPAGTTATVLPEGAVLLQRSADNYTAQFEAPWAKDATGRALRTFYEVEGGALVQTVDVTGATYPIAADPTLGHTWGLPTLYLNRIETSRARSAAYAGWICTFIPFPGNVFCGGNLASVTRAATLAYQHNKCVKFLVGPGALSGQDYTGGNCR